MKTRMRRSVRKNNKSKKNKLKKYGVARGQRHLADPILENAYSYIYDYSDSTSVWLNNYLKDNDNDKDSVDYQKVKEINDMLVKGHKLMKLGYDKLEEFMTTE